jgi:hypothetical protein
MGREPMRGTRIGLRWLSVLLLCLAGCHTDPPIKPTLPDEWNLPPEADARYSSPPNYPKDALDSGQFQKNLNKPPGEQNGPGIGGSGMGRGMGAGGMGAGGMGGGGY